MLPNSPNTIFSLFKLLCTCLLIVVLFPSCEEGSEPDPDKEDDSGDTEQLPDGSSDDETPTDGVTGIIFETNFGNDTNYGITNVGLWNGGSDNITQPPFGWDGVLATGNSSVAIHEGEGVDGSNALKLSWDPDLGQPVAQLAKHLTGDVETGYDELYIRYHVRLPNSFKAGDDASFLPYWKWGRLWQNTTIETSGAGLTGGNWTENRVDSRYVVWNFGGSVPYTDVNVVWGENEGSNLENGSAGGERQGVDFFVSGSDQHDAPGYFESLWDINMTDRIGELENNTDQGWHTIEYRFKLATDETSDDGEFQMWWDGIDQGSYARIMAQGGAPERNGIPTAKGDGSGFNFFVFFDNLGGWNQHWGEPGIEGGVWVNDVVVSTERIGHEYAAGNTDNVP